MKDKLKREDGFIMIVALGIFALLMIFGLMVQRTVVDTYENVRNSNNYLTARVTADGAMEYLQFMLKYFDPGYNTGDVECLYGTYNNGEPNISFCDHLGEIVGDKNVAITLVMKGRSDDAEKLKTQKCGAGFTYINNNCYVVPIPGTGDAGENCKMYDPDYFADPGSLPNIDTDLVNVVDLTVDQLDYSCNWNKLRFGSSLIDRVAVPLHYDVGIQADNTVSPFLNPNARAQNFMLRVRTPCKPCGAQDTPGTINCSEPPYSNRTDETVCHDADRYVLDTDNDDIVVQWQFSGTCDNGGEEGECGLVAIPDPGINSAIFESKINQGLLEKTYLILKNNTKGYRTEIHPPDPSDKITEIINRLGFFIRPILTLFLSEALISTDGTNIPYLEYQVLTDHPIANPKTGLEVTVNVEGNVFKKTLLKEEQKPLIDFAVQN